MIAEKWPTRICLGGALHYNANMAMRASLFEMASFPVLCVSWVLITTLAAAQPAPLGLPLLVQVDLPSLSGQVLQLAAEGKLSLDDSIERRLPGVVPNGDKITIRRLLNHTTGLFDYENDPSVLKPYLNGNLGYAWAPRRLVQIALSHKPLFKPGDRYSYSNTNYMIAGLIIKSRGTVSVASCVTASSSPSTSVRRASRSRRAYQPRSRTATTSSASPRRPTSAVSTRSRGRPERSSPPPTMSSASTGHYCRGTCYRRRSYAR